MNSKPRWLRYSARSLLIIIALFAVWLGVQVHRANRQRQLINTVGDLGGHYFWDYQCDKANPQGWASTVHVHIPDASSAVPPWLRNGIGEEYFHNLYEISLMGTKAADDHLSKLAACNEIRVLDLDFCQVGDPGLHHLAGLTKLIWLDLEQTNVTDEGLRHLSKLKELQFLILDKTNISDQGLQHLKDLSELTYLRLQNTQITDDGIRKLNSLPKLKYLFLGGTDVTDDGIASLNAALPECYIQSAGPFLRREDAAERRIAQLEAKLANKNEAIAELTEENVKAKKANGEL